MGYRPKPRCSSAGSPNTSAMALVSRWENLHRGSRQRVCQDRKTRLIALGGVSIYPPFRQEILRHFKDQRIAWWGGSEGPTDNPISSQVACLNHLEPARLNHDVAISLARRFVLDAVEVLKCCRSKEGSLPTNG